MGEEEKSKAAPAVKITKRKTPLYNANKRRDTKDVAESSSSGGPRKSNPLGARAMQKSIKIFEKKCGIKPSSRDGSAAAGASSKTGGTTFKEKGKPGPKSPRPKERHTWTSNRNVNAEQAKGKTDRSSPIAADRKRVARSTEINSNLRSSFKQTIPKSLPEESKQPSSTKKKEDAKALSRSTGTEPGPSIPKKEKVPRRDSQDDLSLLFKKATHPQPIKRNSFTGTNGIGVDLLSDLPKLKLLDSKDKSKSIRRVSLDVVNDKPSESRRPGTARAKRRNSLDESTLNVFTSLEQHKASLIKRSSSEYEGGKDDVDDDPLGALTGRLGGRGLKNSTTLKKSITSDCGRSERSAKESKDITKTNSSESKHNDTLVPTRKTNNTSDSTSSNKSKIEKKNPGRRASAQTATPIAVVAPVAKKEKGFRVSRLTMCAVCVLYIISLGLVGVLGFWLHMILFPSEEQVGIFIPGGDDVVEQKAPADDEGSKVSILNVGGPTFSPSTDVPTSTVPPTTKTQAPLSSKPTRKKKKPSKEQVASIKNPPASSISPSITAVPISPAPSALDQSRLPTYAPSTSFPTYNPSTVEPTISHDPSSVPSPAPSSSLAPSSTPTGIPKCPDELMKIADLGDDSLITMRYEIVTLPLSDPYGGASRDPAFGRKEAIIGIPGVTTLVAAASGEDVSVGQQVGTAVLDGPQLVNPGKYEIPAGGGVDGYTGPSIDTMLPIEKQTLLDSTIAIVGPDDSPLQKPTTTMTFTKYLIEPDEIEIDPFKKTLLLYAVASIDEDGEYNDNPEWIANYVTLLESDVTAESRNGVTRKRLRHHINN
eukprot:scaffold105641_cov66-Cyclotella_meneghiniana.AAC.1